jgi:predicted nucleic acid-binding protein
VAVALVVVDHDQHAATVTALRGRSLGLAGHAAFETFSVLTRLPAPLRMTPAAVEELLRGNFARTRFLGVTAAARLADRLGSLGIAGCAVYDALVGAAALEHGVRLATRDRRAIGTYRALGVDVEVLA